MTDNDNTKISEVLLDDIQDLAEKMAENLQDRDRMGGDTMMCAAFLIGIVKDQRKDEDDRLAFPIEASWFEAVKAVTNTELGLLHKLGVPGAPPIPGDENFVGFLENFAIRMLFILKKEGQS